MAGTPRGSIPAGWLPETCPHHLPLSLQTIWFWIVAITHTAKVSGSDANISWQVEKGSFFPKSTSWRFSKHGNTPNDPKLEHFSIESLRWLGASPISRIQSFWSQDRLGPCHWRSLERGTQVESFINDYGNNFIWTKQVKYCTHGIPTHCNLEVRVHTSTQQDLATNLVWFSLLSSWRVLAIYSIMAHCHVISCSDLKHRGTPSQTWLIPALPWITSLTGRVHFFGNVSIIRDTIS